MKFNICILTFTNCTFGIVSIRTSTHGAIIDFASSAYLLIHTFKSLKLILMVRELFGV